MEDSTQDVNAIDIDVAGIRAARKKRSMGRVPSPAMALRSLVPRTSAAAASNTLEPLHARVPRSLA